MREVHDHLAIKGACAPALEVFLEYEALTLVDFFDRWYRGGVASERTRAKWSYWLLLKYYTEDVFPDGIMGLCIELSFRKEHRMPDMQALQLFRKVKGYMPKAERDMLLKTFSGKLPKAERPEDR